MDTYAKSVFSFILSQPDHEFMYRMYPDQIPGGIDAYQDFVRACRYIESLGYLELRHPGCAVITHAGLHRRELDRRQFFHDLFTRFIPGFICGIVTETLAGLLVAHILSLWPL